MFEGSSSNILSVLKEMTGVKTKKKAGEDPDLLSCICCQGTSVLYHLFDSQLGDHPHDNSHRSIPEQSKDIDPMDPASYSDVHCPQVSSVDLPSEGPE